MSVRAASSCRLIICSGVSAANASADESTHTPIATADLKNFMDTLIGRMRLMLSAWMMLLMQGFHARLRHMRVNLCRTEITVAEQQLYDTQIGPMIQQMCGKGVTQRMR